MREVRWERMFPDELEAAFQACPVVYFAYGLCEPHGPQNTVGLDSLKAHAIACRAAHAHGGIVAPPDFWHIHEIGGYALWSERAVGQIERSWLTCMPPWQHFKNICYHVRQVDTLGFEAAILITGHYGPNWQDLKTLCDLIQPHVGTRLYSLPDFEANTPGFHRDHKSGGDHAGCVETSLLWALEPECVDISRMPAETEPGPHFAMGGTARQSNRKVGERMVNDEVIWLGD
ncbi:MAG: creatininase family protein, partial [bacterium]|nr:creatininase family protein [bacterium]